MCGFESVTDPQYIHRVLLNANLTTNRKLYWDTITRACEEFKFKTPKINPTADLKTLLAPINRILQQMYGIAITSRSNEKDMFLLTRNTMFTTDPETSINKHLPLILPIANTIGLVDEKKELIYSDECVDVVPDNPGLIDPI
jgi:hypothetical protein